MELRIVERTYDVYLSGYILQGKDPLLPPGMRELLHEDLNKSFDF